MVRLFTPSCLRLIILFGLAIGLGMNGAWAQNAGTSSSSESVTVSADAMKSMVRRLDTLEAQKEYSKGSKWAGLSGEKFVNKFGGRIQGDYVMFANQNDANEARFGDIENYMEFRRVRFFASGEGYGGYFYKLQVDFESEDGDISFKDVYLGKKDVPFLGEVRFGHSKVPYSLEALTSSKYITFMERAMAVSFLPIRRVGMRSTKTLADESMMLQWGVFFDDISSTAHERVDDNQGISLIGRWVATPYYHEGGRNLLHLGVMGAWTESGDGAVRWRTRPEVHEGPRLIDSGTLLAEDHYDLGAQAAAVLGPLSIQSELFYKRTQGLTQDFDIYGAYAFVSFFLTGEHRPYKRSSAAFDRVRPNSNFGFVRGKEGRDGGWGAWEAVARWSYYDVAAGTGQDAGKENNLTAGFNWYWNPNMRMMMDWTHGWTQYNVGDDNELDIIGLRMQVDF